MHAMRTSLAFLTSLMLFGCAHDGPGLRLMNERAEYDNEAPETSELNLSASGALGDSESPQPRPEPRVAQVWIHPQRLSNHEHFWGAWISLRLEEEHWEAKSLDKFEQQAPLGKPKDDGRTPQRRSKKKMP